MESLFHSQHLIIGSESNYEGTQNQKEESFLRSKNNKSINLYFNQKKELYDLILEFIENEEQTNEEQTNKIMDFLNIKKIVENQIELKLFLRLIKNIAENHHRSPNFNQKIKHIFYSLKDAIKQNLSNFEIFNLFSNNKLILLYLFEMDILTINKNVLEILSMKSDKNGTKYRHFFYPELKKYIDQKSIQKIEKELIEIDDNILDNFEEKRQKGENDSYICELIREDNVIDFIIFVNKKNISLNSKINWSLFETNHFLINNEHTLIEYSAFFGSIEIFQYLRLNQIELQPKIWLYSIHSNDAQMIHLNEELNKSNFDNMKCIKMSIKCHHNQITNYFLNYDNIFKSSEIILLCLQYDNFEFIPNIIEYDDYYNIFLIDLLQNDYIHIVNIDKAASFICENHGYIQYMKNNNYNFLNFQNYRKLTQFESLPTLKNIININFDGCISLTYVSLPSSIQSIPNNAFYKCFSLIKVVLPSSIKRVNRFAFEDCFSLTTIQFYKSEENNKILKSYVECSLDFSIDNFAFKNCKSLIEIEIPPQITKIKEYAFYKCYSLSKVQLHNSITFIGYRAFSECPNIKIDQLSIPSKLINIGFDIFTDNESIYEKNFNLFVDKIPTSFIGKDLYNHYVDNCEIGCAMIIVNTKKVDLDQDIKSQIGMDEFFGYLILRSPKSLNEIMELNKKGSKTTNIMIYPTIECYNDQDDSDY